MGSYQEIKGDLIDLALKGEFDVIVHGCNCFSKMKSGIAPLMVTNFFVDQFDMEKQGPNINKLGCIDFERIVIGKNANWRLNDAKNNANDKEIIVVNAYTQYDYKNSTTQVNLSYEALSLCFFKINKVFYGKKIGLPGLIGCGKARGDENIVKEIIKKEANKCDIIVCYL